MAYKLDEARRSGPAGMRSLIHRRHSLRAPGDVHLSSEGLALAREVGRTSGPFDRVVTSPKPRAVETAIAMGYSVDAEWEELGSMADPVGRFLEREAPSTFGEFVRWATTVHEVRAAAEALARRWGNELDRLPEGGRMLLVSHAGVVELGAAGAVPDLAIRWGATLAPLEGIRLDRDRGRWVDGAVIRTVPLRTSGDRVPDAGSDGHRISASVDRAEEPPRRVVLK
ncbi:MAG: histidine phosphatase family protein [Thermoplasmata archaeon]|nr:histidine phosphatase family protein [Thermoplasmata archaeon]